VWLDVAVTLVIAFLAWRLTRDGEPDLRPFFTLLVLASLFNVANLITWRMDLSVPNAAWDSTQGSNEFPLYYSFLAAFLFLWDCAWLYLTVTLIRRQGFGLANWTALLVLLGFIGVYAIQYQSFGFEIVDAEQRVLVLLFALELVGVLLGVVSTLLGVTWPYLFMILGFAVFASIHIVGIQYLLQGQDEASATLQPLWTLGRAFVFAGIWLLFPSPAKGEAGASRQPSETAREVGLVQHGRHYSQLSSILIVFALGAVFVVVAVDHFLGNNEKWFVMFFVLFCVTGAIFMSIATTLFDHAISHVRGQLAEILGSKLERIRRDDGQSRIQRTLKLTGLDSMLAEFRYKAAELRDNVIVLGPERLNRPTVRSSVRTTPRCFIMMPFSAEWSAAVNRLIRDACNSCGVQPMRGDDIFSPTDILDDIWQQIIVADFVIADLTDRNSNVFYELGMAHAVGKPVILLSQRESDVPIDLKTRRWLPYNPEQGEALDTALRESITQVLEMYELRPAVAEEGAANIGDRETEAL
jgi:hypothetical protein